MVTAEVSEETSRVERSATASAIAMTLLVLEIQLPEPIVRSGTALLHLWRRIWRF
jgi:uncharacterized membrane protein